MHDLYSEQDCARLSARLKKRYCVLGAVLAVLLALFVVSMVFRVEWLSIVLFILFCSTAVFVIEMFCIPLHKYKRLVVSALTGRSHVGTFEYESTEADPSVVDGVACHGLIFLGEPDKHGTRAQRFYWDREIPLPAFSPGDRVTLKYTGRTVIGYGK